MEITASGNEAEVGQRNARGSKTREITGANRENMLAQGETDPSENVDLGGRGNGGLDLTGIGIGIGTGCLRGSFAASSSPKFCRACRKLRAALREEATACFILRASITLINLML